MRSPFSRDGAGTAGYATASSGKSEMWSTTLDLSGAAIALRGVSALRACLRRGHASVRGGGASAAGKRACRTSRGVEMKLQMLILVETGYI
jgi:hypothetical protein